MEDVLLYFGVKLFGGFQPSDGMPEPELARLERKLQLRLPAVLRSFYLLAGRNKVIMRAHNRFLAAPKIRNNALVFLEENQKVMFWGIFLQYLNKTDPPVQQGNYDED